MSTVDKLIADNVGLIDDRTERLSLMTQLTSQVSQASLVRQAVLNTSQSIELLREAVSNSVDANCRQIDIQLTNAGGQLWNIVIQDDGHGMEDRHMKAFFNSGESEKDSSHTTIGEKGLGSKTCFVAKDILVESRRYDDETNLLVGRMTDPLADLLAGRMPDYTIELNPANHQSELGFAHGTRITLSDVHITRFNGKETNDPQEIAERLLHYLRSMCATGTVKNRHATKQHIIESIANVSVAPELTLEVVLGTESYKLGPEPGVYQIPTHNPNPTTGRTVETVQRKSENFCDYLDFSASRTLTINGVKTTVHYDGTAIIAGDEVRNTMLKHELKQGWTHKSQNGVHLCKDFIPLKADNAISRQLIPTEYYYEFKVFLNCQNFQLNADRNVVTNEDSTEISWIFDHFRDKVWPKLEDKARPYNDMKKMEDLAIKAVQKTREATTLKNSYSTLSNLIVKKQGAQLKFVKKPLREADVSHLLAMMVQSGSWTTELAPIMKFGQYIDASTDVLVEDGNGQALLLEIETTLPNLFRHRHPLTSYDLVVVWELGKGNSKPRKFDAPWGKNGTNLKVDLQRARSGGWELKWGTHPPKPLIVLKDIL